jgi:hypothetical protein
LAVWILTFSYCALSNSEYFQDIDFFNKDLSIFLSPFVWFVFILYLCFPSKIACNYEGRKHIFRVFKHIICLPFKKLTLQTSLEVDQVMSFLVVIKDFNYTVCYVKNIVTTHTAVNKCSGPGYDFTEMCIILFFLIWNFCPTLVDFFRTLLNKESMDEDEYSRARRKGLYIIFRNIVSISCSGISYYTSNDDLLFYYWVYATIFVTLALFYADLVDEWGFLAAKNLLREKLSYPKKGYYYIAIFMNFFLRLSWTLSLSNVLSSSPLEKSCLVLLTSLMECVRRMIWNFIKVEFEHLKLEGNFNAVRSYDLPFDLNIDMSDPDIASRVNKQVNLYLKKAYINNPRDLDMEDNNIVEKIFVNIEKERKSPANTDLTIKNDSSFMYVDEEGQKKELLEYDRSLLICKIFIERFKELGITSLDKEYSDDISTKNSSCYDSDLRVNRNYNRQAEIRNEGPTKAFYKQGIIDSEIVSKSTDAFFRKALADKK